MTAKENVLNDIKRNSKKIRSYGVKNMYIFGSFVRSLHKTDSDLDILIEFQKDEKTFDNYMELKFFLEKLFQRNVDLVIKEALKPALRKHVLEEAVDAKL